MNGIRMRLVHMLPHHVGALEAFAVLLLCLVMASQPAYAADVIRLRDRSLMVAGNEPSSVTQYRFEFGYTTPADIGSVDFLFCINPIPDEPCYAPPGLDVSNATLLSQLGEAGYSISVRSPNHLVISRPPTTTGSALSSYTFGNIVNPSQTATAFAVRLSTYESTNATGGFVNLGSVRAQMATGINLATQVPPILVFCLARQVALDCEEVDEVYYTDMGDLSPQNTLLATSQMAAGTNATDGYTITVNGTTLQSGNSTISNLATPSASSAGLAQFGLNLRENSSPEVGQDPDGPWSNAVPTPAYNTPDRFTFNDGDPVVNVSEVSLMRRFTVSYVVNSPPTLRAGVYTTTLTYICSGRF